MLNSLDKAIVMNGAAIEMNRQAFAWGRRAAVDRAAVERVVAPPAVIPLRPASAPRYLDERIARRAAFLTAYQDAAYPRRYTDLVARVRAAEAALGSQRLADAVADGYFKLACKDEYEVARLYADPAFWQQIGDRFEGDYTLQFHLAPPLFARPDPRTGRIAKRAYGPPACSHCSAGSRV